MIGPLFTVYYIIRKGWIPAANYGLVPGKYGNLTVVAMYFNWAILAACLYLLIDDRIDAARHFKETGEERFVLEIKPLAILTCMVLFRQIHLAIRHATTNRFTYNEWFGENARYADKAETLLMYAWVELSPKFIMEELKLNMISAGSQDATFKFKVLSPVYEPVRERLKNPSYFSDTSDWTFAKDIKERRNGTANMAVVWNEFKSLNLR